MSRRLDFTKASRNNQARFGLNVKDETEWMENDAAARWLRRGSRCSSQRINYRALSQRLQDLTCGDFDALRRIVEMTGIPGRWKEGENRCQFRAENRGILNFWKSTGTINFQGPEEAAAELNAAFLVVLQTRGSSSEMKPHPRKGNKTRHSDLAPCDPHDQLSGVDGKQIPWV